MTLSREDSALLQLLDDPTHEGDSAAVAATTGHLELILKDRGIQPLYDDAAAALDAAIFRYILVCREAQTKANHTDKLEQS